MDMELSQLRPAYYYTLQRYNTALRQRNALLKPDAKADMNAVRQQLYIWDEQLSKTGAEIMRMRAEFVQRLGLIASRLHRRISGEREALLVRYAPDVDIERMGGGDAEAALSEALYNGALDDIRRGYTGSGPHRDELELNLNGTNVRVFGSQGQQRTAALSLKLLLSALKFERTGDNADCKYAHILGDAGNYGSCARARSAAHAGSNEYHISTLERVGDNVAALLGRFLADFGSAACALTLCQLLADLNLMRCAGMIEYLLVRIDSNKFSAEHTAVNHTVDGVSAASADAYNFYLRGYLAVIIEFKRHFVTPKLNI